MLRTSLFKWTRSYATQAVVQKKQSPLITRMINEYETYAPKVIDESLAKVTYYKSSELKHRIKTASEYYTLGRKPVQGEFMLFTFESLNPDYKITDELIHQLQVLVTTIEMLQAYFFFWDDLEDGSQIRQGKPCWHLLENIGLMAFNDACMVRSFIDEIIRQNFKGEMRDNMLNVYHKVYSWASAGQFFDATVARSRNYDAYDTENYDLINGLKSSSYSIKSPILLALSFCNKFNKESFDIVDSLGYDIGILVQIHNDMVDYNISKGMVNNGKSGSDIQEGKCSWVAIAVLEKCSPAERRVFAENYGSTDPEKIKRIIQLCEEKDIHKLYKREEQRRYDIFCKKISELPKNAIPSAEFFKSFHNLVGDYTQDITNLMYDKYS